MPETRHRRRSRNQRSECRQTPQRRRTQSHHSRSKQQGRRPDPVLPKSRRKLGNGIRRDAHSENALFDSRTRTKIRAQTRTFCKHSPRLLRRGQADQLQQIHERKSGRQTSEIFFHKIQRRQPQRNDCFDSADGRGFEETSRGFRSASLETADRKVRPILDEALAGAVRERQRCRHRDGKHLLQHRTVAGQCIGIRFGSLTVWLMKDKLKI